ncbi:MAG: type II toxin-antitoxin system RelE/ParE family toxin [Aristaeellaceae bacterium]
MADFRIRYTQQAMDDLDAIFDYICLDNPNAARKMLQDFRTGIEKLAATPYLGAALRSDSPMMISSGYRYIVVSPYLVFYRVVDQEIRIGRILHSRQDWLSLLFGIR